MTSATRPALLALLFVCGCGSSSSNDGGSDLGVADLAEAADMSQSTLGGPCTTTDQCSDGKTPVCFTKTLFNKGMPYLNTKGGYCSSACVTDADCGAAGVCNSYGTDGKWCMVKCAAPAECRSGYACFTGRLNNCFPDGALNCDPQMGEGTCSAGSEPGGCVRTALGIGIRGICQAQCELGKQTCAMGHCLFVDSSFNIETGVATGDTFRGGLCINAPATVANGSPCTAGGQRNVAICVDGSECDYRIPTVNPNGDDKCYSMCYLPGGGPVPDGGVGVPPGGIPVGPCATGTCTDIIGLASAPNPSHRFGLCK